MYWHWRLLAAFVLSCGVTEARSSSAAAGSTGCGPSANSPARSLDVRTLDGDLSVPVLARRAGMSERSFGRVFKQQRDTTPAGFVARLRTDAAPTRLAET